MIIAEFYDAYNTFVSSKFEPVNRFPKISCGVYIFSVLCRVAGIPLPLLVIVTLIPLLALLFTVTSIFDILASLCLLSAALTNISSKI
jgi:hypothetical protein